MDLGYQFAPPEYPHAPGSPRMAINLYEIPTCQHYDPEQLALQVINKDGFPDSLTVTHPWPQGDEIYRVCVGHATLKDRTNKVMGAYTLGGELTIQRSDDKTHCILKSKAPILQLGKVFKIPTLLAAEIEILVAERAAAWLPDLEKHQKRLAIVDPLMLYTSCLKKFEDKYAKHEHPELAQVIEFRTFIANEISTLKEISRWPRDVPDVEELI
jgi:hypothetical protein